MNISRITNICLPDISLSALTGFVVDMKNKENNSAGIFLVFLKARYYFTSQSSGNVKLLDSAIILQKFLNRPNHAGGGNKEVFLSSRTSRHNHN